MKKWFFLLLLSFPLIGFAQTYKYIGVKDGLSNRRVYYIQKDLKGYMWFLTHEGIDRYNGKEFKHYKLMDGNEDVNSLLNINWLFLDKGGVLWEVGKKGKIFRYDALHDKFTLVYKLPEQIIQKSPAPISYSFIAKSKNIWLCSESTIYLYNTKTQKTSQIKNGINEAITDVEQIDDTHFFVGTEMGVHYAELNDSVLKVIPCNKLDNIAVQVNELFFHAQSRKLFIGTFQRGIYVYDMNTKEALQPKLSLTDVTITRIKPLNNKDLLIATDGAGVYKLDIETYETDPYIVADYSRNNGMNGNSINDIYVDNEQRIWLANYPIGITVCNSRYSSYDWIKHAIGNEQSLVNDQVNSIIEDSDGDLWFGTNNGISLKDSKTGKWHTFLSSFNGFQRNKNHIFTTLCEVTPGIIWAGGYSSGIYQINKESRSVNYFTPSLFAHSDIRPDKYIRDITKDSSGDIWSGGYYNLKCFNLKNKTIRLYDGLNSITTIVERNKDEMWIGSATGLYLLNKESKTFKNIKLPVESTFIYSLYKAHNGELYIGTSGSGLLIYNPDTEQFTHYHTENCALISNNIYTILSDADEDILISTENGLASFYPEQKSFHNWTREQGLMTIHFNASSGVLRKNNHFIVGSSDGAVEFPKDIKIPRAYSSRMIFSDFKLFYQTVYPGDKNSPLMEDIDNTQVLRLKSSQNIFSIDVSSINYDYPSNMLYSWKLKGFYDKWSRPGSENVIRFTNLSPGKYTLHVRVVSNEDKRIVLEERTIDILIALPLWLSFWAILMYVITIGLIGSIILRIFILRKQRKISNEKIHFFINTAHDIRTPLTLIKAPLEELSNKEELSKDGATNMNTALRNVNVLLKLASNLINFERADLYSPELYTSEYELNAFMTDAFNTFQPYANMKRIDFTYESNFQYLNVRIDKEKMDSILKNIISNALKYTPEEGNIHLFVSENNDTWSVEVRDSGIGIPACEQKKLFKTHFRGSNAINSKVTGSGIGLMLAWKLVHIHKGKITMNSIEHQGSTIKATFPKNYKHSHKADLTTKAKSIFPIEDSGSDMAPAERYEGTKKKRSKKTLQRILLVEDNDELRGYLNHTLSDHYAIQTCGNGKEALEIVKVFNPELIISDIMMPEMRGDELCVAIKHDIETSHIPIILLTALNDEQNIVEGLRIGADEYVVKPFSIGILKATIANLLTNRALLRNEYANVEINDEGECFNCSSDIDWKFIASVKRGVEQNMDNPELSVDMLCNLLNMSRTSFYSKIKALTDQAPADYIRLIRLKHAAQLLKAGQHNITEIAEMTGFSDPKYFREVFKKRYKMSPSKYGKGEETKKES